ncbi:phosphatase PAP2 family protein [Dactylosporangium sp. NBC_01737]|uniref:phosphatase PAP2 family protein n=1 Tax=Dactylosporangium sp. NBC_01737 TaxID=2975959 RepID=UPI002E1572F2|nr:phosphatase PAP2 family protein [Dactylosporangium sp. NBC_01737]
MRNVRPALWFDLVLLALFAAITIALALRTPLLSVDLAVRDLVDAHRPSWAYWTARVFNYLGQGGQVLTPLAVLTAIYVGWRTHSIRPALPVLGGFVITYLTIGPLKLWTDRLAASSPDPDHPEYLFHADAGMSYPSGHVVNAIVWYGVLAILLGGLLRPGQLRAIRYGAPAVVLFTTTFLSFHWLTDGLAAICLGVVLDRILQRVPWDTVPLPAWFATRGWSGPIEPPKLAEPAGLR